MKKFRLDNGMSVVCVETTRGYSVCLSLNVGHVNEPKLGIANLFERTLLQQVKGIIPVFGGTMTAYTASGAELHEVLEKIAQIFKASDINEEFVSQAKASIVQQTNDAAPLTMRRMKLLYKHTAFGADLVKSTEEYLEAVNSYTVKDVRRFANAYYTASNAVLVIAGPKVWAVKDLVAKSFECLPEGERRPLFKGDIYTGGAGFMEKNGSGSWLMFGWDVQHLSISDSPAVNVMMSMFLRRLERAYSDAGLDDVQVDLKIAGYYGLRTMRVLVMSPTVDPKTLTDVLVAAVNRLCDTQASDVRMEKSRSAAMVEKLDKYERSDDRALETAWQIVGRGAMYDVSTRIMSIADTTAYDVMDVSREIFRRVRLTYIVAAAPGVETYSYNEVMHALYGEHLLKESEKA